MFNKIKGCNMARLFEIVNVLNNINENRKQNKRAVFLFFAVLN